MKKIPDNIVYSEEEGYYSKLLPYGSNISAPKLETINLTPWKADGIKRVNDQLYSKFSELKREYDRLMDELKWNEMIYNSKFNFEPLIGGIYHLYNINGNICLSIIHPNEWGSKRKDIIEFIGTFQLTSTKKWEMVKTSNTNDH
jgi:hypothetical protein